MVTIASNAKLVKWKFNFAKHSEIVNVAKMRKQEMAKMQIANKNQIGTKRKTH